MLPLLPEADWGGAEVNDHKEAFFALALDRFRRSGTAAADASDELEGASVAVAAGRLSDTGALDAAGFFATSCFFSTVK